MSHRRIALLGLLVGVLIIAIALPPRARAQAAPAEATERVTVDIELEDCAKTLRRVARLFGSGFGRADAERLAREIEALPTDKAGQWTYQVEQAGAPATLVVRALVDELSMVDLDFLTTPAIAARIRKALGEIER